MHATEHIRFDIHPRPIGRAIAERRRGLLGDPTEFMGTNAYMRHSDARVAVISDVHANLPALESVLADIDARGITRIWCLGDTTGYGAHPVECLRLVRDRCEIVLAGNHDLAVVGDEALDQFGHHARPGVRHAQVELERARDGADLREWLALRLTEVVDARRSAGYDLTFERMLDHHAMDAMRDGRIVAAHAAPAPFDSVWDYVGHNLDHDSNDVIDALPGASIILVGHSHQQFVDNVAVTDYDLGAAKSWDRCVANPGAVGQPRDGDPRAAWLELMIGEFNEQHRITLRRTEYDVAAARAAIEAADLPAMTAARLESGM
jgi:predicted phosphodiesterase